MKISKETPRLETSRIPREIATRALLNIKMSGRSRRLFMRARDRVIDITKPEQQNEQEHYCRMLKNLTMRQLGRRLVQAQRALRKTQALLDNTKLESFRKPLENYVARLQYRLGWIRQEAEKRQEGILRASIDDTGN